MFPCNTTAITDWSSFLSRILPFVNGSAGFVHRGVEEAEAVTVAAVTLAPGPPGRPPTGPGHTPRHPYPEGDAPIHREPVPLPEAVLYLVMAALVVVLVAYAIVGHLVKDLVHECVEWAFGPRSRNRRAKRDVGRAAGHEMSELPGLLDANYITHNHTDRPDSLKHGELAISLGEALELHHHQYRVT